VWFVTLRFYSTDAPIGQVPVLGTGTCSLLNKYRTITGAQLAKYRLKGFVPLRCRAIVDWQAYLEEESIMIYWTLVFLVVALIAGVLGFTGVAVAAAGIAKLIFFVFLVLFVLSLVTHLTRRGSV